MQAKYCIWSRQPKKLEQPVLPKLNPETNSLSQFILSEVDTSADLDMSVKNITLLSREFLLATL